jgi:DNA repair exonuclease SbcCD ATPase subunit
VQRERQAARERLQADLDRELRTLEDTAKGNRLLEKLQGARPQIADRLWKVVLTSVSTYFSTIRGKASIVTREDNGFRVDGQPVEGLSGSTLDALGLAIRVALVKTFLPNCGFMVLDEPAAACDDGRETNMLGLVASIGFDQIVLVTHSDLSDAFAQQVIQL